MQKRPPLSLSLGVMGSELAKRPVLVWTRHMLTAYSGAQQIGVSGCWRHGLSSNHPGAA